MYFMTWRFAWALPLATIFRPVAADTVPLANCADAEGAVCDTSPLPVESPSLLQTRRKHEPKESRSMRRVSGEKCENKFAWFHIPKCGTSFANTLYHAANSSLPAEAILPSAETLSDSQWDLVGEFHESYPMKDWFEGCFWHRNEQTDGLGTHESILQMDFDQWAGNFVGIFREPRARAKSSHKFFSDRCGKMDVNSKQRQCETAPELGCDCTMAAPEYAARMTGLVTKMLTGQSDDSTPCSFVIGECVDQHVKPDVDMALERLKGFKFIGLTEEWDLSVCLFHTMFGGNCSASEFSNVRLTDSVVTDEDKSKEEKSMDDAFWEDFVDPYDSVVYGAASRIFWESVGKYNVSLESCARICPLGGM